VPTVKQLTIHPKDLDWKFTRGSGAGGQHRNKTESAVDLTHIPTGVVVHCESERSQNQNKDIALSKLRAKLWASQSEASASTRAKARKEQVGTGQRGDKAWTVRTQDDQVTYHGTGQKFRLRDYLDGNYQILNM
jgi:peptide chain release factor 1